MKTCAGTLHIHEKGCFGKKEKGKGRGGFLKEKNSTKKQTEKDGWCCGNIQGGGTLKTASEDKFCGWGKEEKNLVGEGAKMK